MADIKKGTTEVAPIPQEHNITRLLKLQDKVEVILERSLKARGNDNYLAYRVYHDYYHVDMKEALAEQEERGLPSVESIGRVRRKAQRERPELRAGIDKQTKRLNAKVDFINYSGV